MTTPEQRAWNARQTPESEAILADYEAEIVEAYRRAWERLQALPERQEQEAELRQS